MAAEISPEMRLFSPGGERLYLTAQERQRFLAALDEESPMDRLFCRLLHFTGCRPSEALELTVGRILVEEMAVVFRSLKKRKKDSRGREKQPQFRTVPVPEILIEQLDYVYEIRRLQKKSAGSDVPLWTMSRPTAYRHSLLAPSVAVRMVTKTIHHFVRSMKRLPPCKRLVLATLPPRCYAEK